MDDHALVLCGLWWLYEVGRGCAGPLALCLERVEDLDDGVAVFGQAFLSHLDVHLGSMLLQAQLGVLLEPPGSDLSLTNPTEYRHWWRVCTWIVGTRFC